MDTKELVERCRRGDEQARSLLYTAYVRKMERVCRKYVKNEDDVQDIVHDSFVIIFTSIGRLKDAGRLESWMCTIVRNLSLKHLQQPPAVDVDGMEAKDGDEAPQPDYSRLMTIVEQLPVGYKNVLKLSVLEGLSHKEIGEMLGIEPHSSSSQLARAKVMVRRNARRYGVVLLALIAAIVPFLRTEEEEGQTKEVAEKASRPKDVAVAKDSTDSVTNCVPAPVRQRRFIVRNVDVHSPQDTLPTLVAEAAGCDTTIMLPADTARRERLVVPDLRQDDRLVADDGLIKRYDSNEWSLAVSFAGGRDNSLLASATLPGSSIGSGVDGPDGTDAQAPDTIVNTRTRHYMPIVLGLSFNKSLSRRWSIETGVRYTLLRSDVTTVTSLSDDSQAPAVETTTQKLHYIGIPLKVGCGLWDTRRFSLYTAGGAAADIPVGTSRPVLWSVNLGAGLQYRLTPGVSLYAEPSLNYYLNPGSGTPTIRTDRPFEFTIPVGFRISW